MDNKKPVRVGVFRTLAGADSAVAGLLEAGFPKESISVICPTCAPRMFEAYRKEPAGARAPEAAAGGAIGGILGGLAAGVGIAASGGTGLLVVGPLLGSIATGGVLGSFIGAMTTRGLESEATNFYDQALQNGQILVAVESDKEDGDHSFEEAERILAEAGAVPLPLRKG